MKLGYVLLIALCCFADAFSQAKNTVAAHSLDDTIILKKLLDSAKGLRFRDTIAHTEISRQAIQLAEKLKHKRFLALAHLEQAIDFPNEKAIKELNTALNCAKEAKDTIVMANANNSIGYRYAIMDQRLKSLDYAFETLRLLNKRPETREFEIALSSVANTYTELGDNRGLEYQQRCYDLVSKRVAGDSVKLSLHLINLGLAYYRFGDTARAIELTEKCLSVAKKNAPIRKHAYTALNNLSLYYSEWSNEGLKKMGYTLDDCLNKVKFYAQQMENFAKENKVPESSNIYFSYGRVLLRKGQYEEALQNLVKGDRLVQNGPNASMRPAYADKFSQAYAGLKQYDSAYKYYKIYYAWNEQATNMEVKKAAERKQAEYEFGKIRDSLQYVENLTNEKLKQQSIIALQQAQELKLNQALLELNVQEKELAQLGFQKANAELLVNQQLIKEKQKQLTLSEKEKALQASETALKRTQLLAANRELHAQKRLQVFYLTGSALVLLLMFVLFRNYKNRQRAKAQIAAEKLKTQKAEAVRKMAEFEMHGLRAQLNPHFMFNSLNAIQAQILREDNENAGTYLNTFAKMLRQLLENAEYSFVSLDKELQFLKLYLSMEQLRIKELRFDMNIDPAIDTERTMIPNMILQPYLENAIWHGLSPKQGSKYVLIDVKYISDGISIRITDNGIGRKRAAELQSKYRKAHKSKGMELLRKRFELIKAEFGSAIKIEIEDLQEHGEDIGTSVHLVIPHTFSEPMMMVRETVFNN